jgi:heat shock protein HslJ
VNRKIALIAPLLAALALVMTACTPPLGEPIPAYPPPEEEPVVTPAEADTGPDLEGTSWQLISYVNEEGEAVAAVPDVNASITFQDGIVSGTSGCNSFSGSYTLDGTQISIGEVASTLMACPEPLMQQEQGLMAALGEAAAYTIEGDGLQLVDGDGNVLAVFTPVIPAALVGPTWYATGYNNGRGGFTSLVIDTEITAVFGEDGALSGNAGCNNYTARYTVDGDAIQIGPAASTRMMCSLPEGVMQQEQEYLAALETADVYRIEGDMLEMRTSEGALVASYTAQPPVMEAAGDTLAGPVWQWQGSKYNNDTEAVPADPSRYTVQFNEDGTVAVRADCNNASGNYTTDGSSISIEILATTLAACPEDSLEQEFLRDLDGAAIYFFLDGDLYLDIQMDAGTMQFAQ